jgi:MFS family permease
MLTATRGIGNLFGIPIAIAIGRRMVFLVSSAILLIGAILCGTARNYAWHLSARCFMSLAASQSEALVPMITQV